MTGPQQLRGLPGSPGTGPQQLRGLPGSPGTGPQRPAGSGGGTQRVLTAGSGAHRVLDPGTGPSRPIGPGSGAHPVAGRGTAAQPVPGRGTAAQPVPGRGTGAQPGLSRGTAAQPVLSRASGAQPVLSRGTAAQPVLSRASGAQPVLGAPGAPFEDGRDAYPSDDTGQMGLRGSVDTADHPVVRARRRGNRTKRRLRSRGAWLAVAVVVLASAGFAGYRFLYEARVNAPVPSTLRLPTTAPGSADFDATLGKWQHIGTRSEDPEPLTIAELYPPQFVLNGTSYVRTAASVTNTCSLAVYGQDLQAALQSGQCSQVLRASYISGDGTMMGTVGVVNLISSNAAQKAGQVTGAQEIIAPLAAKKGATSKLGNGTGVVQAVIKGHYLMLMWAEFTNLKSPSGSAQRQALEQFAANLVTGSANINLSTRMLTGKP